MIEKAAGPDGIVAGEYFRTRRNQAAERAKQLDYYKTHNRRLRDRDMIRSIFTRDKPGTSDPRIAEFFDPEYAFQRTCDDRSRRHDRRRDRRRRLTCVSGAAGLF